ERAVEVVRYERRADALEPVRIGGAAAERRALAFDRVADAFGKDLREVAGDAGERSAGTGTDDDGVDATLHLLDELAGSRALVERWVRRVRELLRNERVRDRRGELVRPLDGALHPFRHGNEDELAAERFHEDLLFAAVAVRHHEDHAVAARAAD